MIQSWENLVTDRRTDGHTYKSDFIGRCSTNVERPKSEIRFLRGYYFLQTTFFPPRQWPKVNMGKPRRKLEKYY